MIGSIVAIIVLVTVVGYVISANVRNARIERENARTNPYYGWYS